MRFLLEAPAPGNYRYAKTMLLPSKEQLAEYNKLETVKEKQSWIINYLKTRPGNRNNYEALLPELKTYVNHIIKNGWEDNYTQYIMRLNIPLKSEIVKLIKLSFYNGRLKYWLPSLYSKELFKEPINVQKVIHVLNPQIDQDLSNAKIAKHPSSQGPSNKEKEEFNNLQTTAEKYKWVDNYLKNRENSNYKILQPYLTKYINHIVKEGWEDNYTQYILRLNIPLYGAVADLIWTLFNNKKLSYLNNALYDKTLFTESNHDIMQKLKYVAVVSDKETQEKFSKLTNFNINALKDPESGRFLTRQEMDAVWADWLKQNGERGQKLDDDDTYESFLQMFKNDSYIKNFEEEQASLENLLKDKNLTGEDFIKIATGTQNPTLPDVIEFLNGLDDDILKDLEFMNNSGYIDPDNLETIAEYTLPLLTNKIQRVNSIQKAFNKFLQTTYSRKIR